jgi:V8-like Glu-specific endopeptidase
LDRNVEVQSIARLSGKTVYCDQPVYVLGHPAGLPLKYAPGSWVSDVEESYFTTDLDIYSGNSGSPVFDSETHQVIGMVVRGDNRDFRWTDKGWLSVIYPNPDIRSRGAQCTKVSEFLQYCCQAITEK